MADPVKVRFLRDERGFKKGEEHLFVPEAIDSYGDAIELVDPPAQQTSPNGTVEYDRSVISKLEARVLDLRAKLDQTDLALLEANRQLATATNRVAELEAVVAGYAAGQAVAPAAPATEPAPEASTPAAEVTAPAAEVAAPAAEAPAPVTAPTTTVEAAPATPAPVEAAPAAPKPAAAWEATPTASLGIPASLKTILLKAGLDTAGKVNAGLDDGTVLLIEGIGQAKADQLRQHIDSLKK